MDANGASVKPFNLALKPFGVSFKRFNVFYYVTALLFLSSLARAAHGRGRGRGSGSRGGGDVLELSDADYDYLSAEHETMLLMFYAPWCGHCKKLAPDFEKAATKLKGTVQLAKVDCTTNTETCARFGATVYPTLKIFRNGEDSGSYDGPRTADGIVQYMKKQAGPNSVYLTTEADLQNFINNFEASIVGFLSAPDSVQATDFLKAAGIMREQFRFAHTMDYSAGQRYGVDTERVVVFRPPRLSSKFEDSAVHSPSTLSISGIRRFIRDHINGLCPHMTLDNKDKLRGHDLMIAYYDLDYHRNPKGSNYWRNRVMKVMSQYSGRGLSCAVANKKDFLSDLEEEFGFGLTDGDTPFVTIKTRLGYKYTMREEFTRDGVSLERFLEDYFAGRLKRYIKSQPIPEKNYTPVKVVVAESFEDIVNSPDKDVLIQFYSPHCQHCKRLQPVYEQLADTLLSDPNIVIAKMDASANDVPVLYDVQGFPTIYLAAANKKDEPKKYTGARELKDFLKFIRREATHKLPVSGVRQEL